MGTDFRLGIQSYCFRTFKTLDGLIGALKQVGLDYVELWPGHQALDVDEATLRGAIRAFTDQGITIDSCGQVTFTDAGPSARAALAFCKLAGITAITANIELDVVDDVVALCDEYDVNLAIHNHGRDHHLGTLKALDALFSRTSKRVGLCLDTGWMLDAGDDPFEAIERFGDRLYGVHLKDFGYDADGTRRDVIIGTGGLDLPRLMKRLAAMEYRGYLSLEYEGEVDNPLPNVLKCLDAINAAIDAV